jgi:6-phosphogluconate dehydrogenase
MSAHIGMAGLGRMGANMSRRMARGGIKVHAFDIGDAARTSVANESGISTFAQLEAMVASLPSPKVVWLMLPAGDVTENTIAALSALLTKGDLVIDGGNCNYIDTQRRATQLASKGIEFSDCGVSGGVWGLDNGYCLMFGAMPSVAQTMTPFVHALAPSATTGWVHCGPVGSGHFAKMIHNGIEYGMMQAYAEGFALMGGKTDFNFDMAAVGEAWKTGSVVRSWLLDLTVNALNDPAALNSIAPVVADSGEGRWTIDESIRQGTPTPVIALSVMSRFTSQGKADLGNKLLALMRKGFGGHATTDKK